ncbi:hypothetical protein SDC9_62285 [bioreactor metagenome]|jgi:hypothetical protein|uniref:Lipocalin-like domain-containing protein n=1 Tax=bioreactor metagenome TaxID=1076179 RepID=A0A644XJD6_9ZZZZ
MIKGKPFLLIALSLIIGVLTLCGCNDDNPLGGTGPNYNMLFPIETNGLYMTQWNGSNTSFALEIVFDRTTCLFNYTEISTGKKSTDTYEYTYSHPVATLIPSDQTKSILKATTISGRILKDDEMSFVDQKNNPALFKVIRKK